MIRQYKCEEGRHHWTVHNKRGGIQLWIEMATSTSYDGPRMFGGLECHYASPPDYMRDEPPHHTDCWLLKGNCWHDGSSLYAEEYWIPLWLADPEDHEILFKELELEHAKVFGT